VHPGVVAARDFPIGNWPTSLPNTLCPQGFTHVEMLPVAEASVRWDSWGYQVTSVLRADVAARHTRRLPVPRGHASPGRDRRDRGLGARSLPRRTRGRSAASTGRRLYEHSDPHRGEQLDWGHIRSSTSDGRKFATSSSPTALYWLEAFPRRTELRVDARRLDALPRLLPRPEGGWTPKHLRLAAKISRRCSSCRR